MGFKSLFKVRQPGNGNKFEARVKSATSEARKKKFPSTDRSENSGGKKEVGVK